jgi:hypothetical protein
MGEILTYTSLIYTCSTFPLRGHHSYNTVVIIFSRLLENTALTMLAITLEWTYMTLQTCLVPSPCSLVW